MILNGSLSGPGGNTARVIDVFRESLPPSTELDVRHLNSAGLSAQFPTRSELEKTDGFLFTTGTYWDSWGSPLQRFFEQATELEGRPCFFGKPAGAIVTMHSVGGKSVLSRLQGVLNTFGFFVPPMSAMAYSFVNQVALTQAPETTLARDLWCLDDVAVVATNLVRAIEMTKPHRFNWAGWPVDRNDPTRVWVDLVSK